MQLALDEINSLIVEGKSAPARAKLRALVSKKVAPNHRVQVASFARRLSLPLIGLSILNPIVRPTGRSSLKPTPQEVAEYAATLSYIGASEEAIALLKTLNPTAIPQSLLFLAFAHFSRWEYAEALPHLQKYVSSPLLTDYQRLVGKVNLLAALVYERQLKEALPLIVELLKLTTDGNYYLLLGNTLELAAQLSIANGNFKEARHYLKSSLKALEHSDSWDSFFVSKWEVIAELIESKASKKSLVHLNEIRELALKKKHWETVRDCDRFEAICRHDHTILSRVYFGTPFSAFRSRLIADFGNPAKMETSYAWDLGMFETNTDTYCKLEVNLGTLHIKNKTKQLKVGQSMHRLLMTLSSDFYRPLRVAVLHHHIYPQEYFHPSAAPHKVHEVVRRLRLWFSKAKVPLEINESDGFYQLKANAPTRIMTQIAPTQLNRELLLIDKLRRLSAGKDFNIRDVAAHLHLSVRAALRIVAAAKTAGLLKLTGKGPSSRYHF